MKHILLPAVLPVMLALPLAAEQNTTPETQPENGDGFNLMEEGVKLLFRGLLQEVEPALRELEGFSGEMELALRGFAQNMGPGLKDLLEQVEDFSKYHPPEILDNGDIIIRRKSDEELAAEPPKGDVEL